MTWLWRNWLKFSQYGWNPAVICQIPASLPKSSCCVLDSGKFGWNLAMPDSSEAV
jgi:hypothetical protein